MSGNDGSGDRKRAGGSRLRVREQLGREAGEGTHTVVIQTIGELSSDPRQQADCAQGVCVNNVTRGC